MQSQNVLRGSLVSSEEIRRRFVPSGLLRMPARKTAPTLPFPFSRERTHGVREALEAVLKGIGANRVYDRLFPLLSSPDPFLRKAAVSLFGAGGAKAVAFLTSRTSILDADVRILIYEALFTIGSRAAVKVLRRGLRDPDWDVRMCTVEYLGRLQDKESIPDLFEMYFSEHDPAIRMMIVEALAFMTGEESFESLKELLNLAEELCQEAWQTSENSIFFAGWGGHPG